MTSFFALLRSVCSFRKRTLLLNVRPFSKPPLRRLAFLVEQLGSRLAPSVTTTKVDGLALDNDDDGQADPGDTLQYTVVINNNGPASVTGVQYNDNLDVNTT